MIQLHRDNGYSSYGIVTHLNETRMKPPGGGAWTRAAVRAVLKQADVYAPQPALKTSVDAEALIVRLATEGATIRETIVALNAACLKTANGSDEWPGSTIQRIRAKHGLAKRRTSDAEYFSSQVKKQAGPYGCHVWTGRMDPDGYGLFNVNGRNVLAHRYAWEMRHGKPEPDTILHHVCRAPACVNTAHLVPVPKHAHRELHRMEDVVEEAFWNGTLRKELEAIGQSEWPGDDLDPQPNNGRVIGSLRADEAPPLDAAPEGGS